jgi:hypothetical protein
VDYGCIGDALGAKSEYKPPDDHDRRAGIRFNQAGSPENLKRNIRSAGSVRHPADIDHPLDKRYY